MIVTGTQNTKKHGGRPTVVESRRLSKAVTVKFSKKDYEILKVRSRKAKKRLAEYVLLGEITDAVRAYRQDTNKKRKP